MSILGTLAINFIAEHADLDAGVERVKKTCKETASDLVAIGDSGGSAFSGLLMKVGATESQFHKLVAVAKEVHDWVLDGARAADELGESAAKLGMGAAELQGWREAAQESGSSISALESGLHRFEETMGEVRSGSADAAAALKNMGLDAARLAASDTSDALKMVADRLAEIQNPYDKAIYLNEVFGKSGRELGPIFEKGAEAIDKMILRARELGLVLKENVIERASEANDAYERMMRGKKNVQTEATALVAPLMNLAYSLGGNLMMNIGAVLGRLNEVFYGKEPQMLRVGPYWDKQRQMEEERLRAPEKAAAAKKAEKEAAEKLKKEGEDFLRQNEKINAELEKRKHLAEEIAKKARTPDQVYQDNMAELKALREEGLITFESMGQAAAQYKAELDKAKEAEHRKLNPEYTLDSKSMGSVEAFSTIAAAQNAAMGFGSNTLASKDIAKNTGKTVAVLEQVRGVLDEIKAKPVITIKEIKGL